MFLTFSAAPFPPIDGVYAPPFSSKESFALIEVPFCLLLESKAEVGFGARFSTSYFCSIWLEDSSACAGLGS